MMVNKIKTFKRRLWLAAAVLLALSMAGCSMTAGSSPLSGSEIISEADQGLRVHFINVGQGDSTLIEKNGHFMLIDAGERSQGKTVVSYLEKQGVKTLDYVIGTHPHSDHIGGMETVIRNFDVEKIFLPEKEHTTKVYEGLLDAIGDKGLKITLPNPGDTYALGDASFQIISPGKDYGGNLNNWSIGLRLVYGENSFVLCGDAEKDAEKDMAESGFPLKADVLKLSHHGSNTSSYEGFMDQVDPDYGVISCGKNNDYGHPHKEILDMLNKRSIKVLRTDELGTIVAVSDGSKITFPEITEGTEADSTQSTLAEQDYIINTNTRKFHKPDCKSAASIKKENHKSYKGSREELIQKGYEPCKSCNP